MTSGPASRSASDRAAPEIIVGAGRIRVRSAELFSEPYSDACRRFVGHILATPPVTSVEICRGSREATIRFPHRYRVDDLLSAMAGRIGQPSDPPRLDVVTRLLAPRSDLRRVCVYRYDHGYSSWNVSRRGRDWVELQHDVVAGFRHVALRVCDVLEQTAGVTSVRMRPFASSIVVRCGAGQLDLARLLAAADAAVGEPHGEFLEDVLQRDAVYAVSGASRIIHLGLAGASFGMAGVGALVPGIPTVPFVLLTSYFLVRSSPSLNERLLRSRLFGPMLRDWDEHRAVHPSVKLTSLAIMAVTVTLTLVFGGLSAPVVAVVLILSGIGVYVILRLPSVRAEGEDPVIDKRAVLAAS